MSSENTISNQNPLAEVGLLLNDEASLNMNLMRETYNKFNSVTYSTEELNTFKDNILSLLKERDKIFLNKLSDYKTSTDKIKFEFNSENKLTNSKFSKIIDTQAKMTSRLDQLSDYENFVTKTKEKLVSHDIRLTNIRNDFSLATQKYDKIYLDNLELPGYIGRCAKYKNCQSFFLDVIKDLAKLNIYREKNILDLKMYKDKLETIISSMNSILDNNNESQIKYINEMKEKILKDCKSMFEDVSDGMKDIRVENSKYAVDLISTSMNLSKKWEKLEKIKEELLEKFNYDVNKYQMLTDDTIKSFEEFKNEYGVIRRKFMELAEFIKDIRFRKNIGGNVKKKEVKQMVKKMLKKRKSFEGEKVQLLSDITSIENIDYKKYYNIESNDEAEINNESNGEEKNIHNRSKSLKPKNKKTFNNNIKEKEKEKLNEKNKEKINSNKISKEIKQKKEMNQSVEDTRVPRINMNNSSVNKYSNIDKEKEKNKSSRSVNMNMKLNISNSMNNKKNSMNKITQDEKNIKNNLIIDSKNLKDEENFDQKNKEMNKSNKNKDSNIIKLVKNNTNNNIELRNILDDNSNKYTDKLENTTIPLSHRDKEKNIEKENVTNTYNTNNTNNINNSSANNKTNNIINYELNPIKLNNDSKPSLIEDVSTISDVKNSSSLNKDNKFSSEKSVSFISDSNGNNINKFIINDIHLEQNDKIIKELASELEQSTAKKDKFEQKFKTACNNIEPINLLANNKISENKNNNQYQPSNNTKIEINPNNINNNGQINNQISNTNNIEINCDKKNDIIIKENNSDNMIKENVINSNNNINNININSKTPLIENECSNNKINNNIKINTNIDDINNSNTNSNINNSNNIEYNKNSNMNNPNNIVKNESIGNLNPIKISNEIHLNEVINSNSVNSKLHAFDQKLLNLELYTKEKIIEIISQINSLKQNGSIPESNKAANNNNNDTNRTILVPNMTPLSNEKYKTFNTSFINSQNNKLTHHNSFNIEKSYPYESNPTNIENNKNILNINNNITNPNQNLLLNNNNFNTNFNLDKKKYSLRNVNPKQALINSKIQKKNSFSYQLNTNNSINKKLPINSLTENNSNNNNNSSINNNINNLGINNNNNNVFNKNNLNMNNILKQNNTKEIIENTGTKIIQNVNSNEINAKFLKDIEKKIENNTNSLLKPNNIEDLYVKKPSKNMNTFNPNRNNYNDSSFNGAEIKLVDLNKLVNHQLPRNRLVPIHINENDYFEHFISNK
jgi:hypothetical protein